VLGDILGFPKDINNVICDFSTCLPPDLDITRLGPGLVIVSGEGKEFSYDSAECAAALVHKIRREKKIGDACIITHAPHLFENKKGVIPFVYDESKNTEYLEICIQSLTYSSASSKLLYLESGVQMRNFIRTSQKIKELVSRNPTLYIVLVCANIPEHYRLIPNIPTKLFCTRVTEDVLYVTAAIPFYHRMAINVIRNTSKFYCQYRESFDVYVL
jgi:hypothetical protein